MLFTTTRAVSVAQGTHWEYIPDGDEVSINVGQISAIYPNLPDATSLTPALNGAKESCFIALSDGKRYLMAQSYAEVRSEVERLQKPDIIHPPGWSIREKVGTALINLAVKEFLQLILVGVAAAVIILLAGCSTSGDLPTVAAPQEPASMPLATISLTPSALADTPTNTPAPTATVMPTTTPAPTATVTLVPFLTPTPGMPKITWPETEITDNDQWRSWLKSLPVEVACTDELDSVRLTCFRKTGDFQAVTEGLIKLYPNERLSIDLYSPRTDITDYFIADLLECYPPNRHSPAGSCQVSTSYGVETYSP